MTENDWKRKNRFVGATAVKLGGLAALQISNPKLFAGCCFPALRKINTGFSSCVHDGFTGSEPNNIGMRGHQIGFRIPV